jgi:hypothetical protein
MRDSELPDDIRKAIERTPIQFWMCLNRDHQTVTWSGDVASCDTCGLTSEMTQRFTRSIRTHMAEHVLKVSDILLGYRCPACHGKPAVDRWRSSLKRRYVCGCGHQWDLPTRSAQFRASFEASPSALLRAIAETGQMPQTPARIKPEPATDGGPGEGQEDTRVPDHISDWLEQERLRGADDD